MFTSDKQRGIAIVLCHSWPCCYQEQVYREVTDALAPDLAKGYISIEGWKLYTPVSWNVRDCQTCSCGALAKEMDGKKQKNILLMLQKSSGGNPFQPSEQSANEEGKLGRGIL